MFNLIGHQEIPIKTINKILHTLKNDYNVKKIIPNVGEKVKQLCPPTVERVSCGTFIR